MVVWGFGMWEYYLSLPLIYFIKNFFYVGKSYLWGEAADIMKSSPPGGKTIKIEENRDKQKN